MGHNKFYIDICNIFFNIWVARSNMKFDRSLLADYSLTRTTKSGIDEYVVRREWNAIITQVFS